MSRAPVPTPRRGERTRRAPIRYGFEDEECDRNGNEAEAMSVCSLASALSRVSSRRSAELRLRHLQEEQELQRRHEESLRALELLRAQNELERATLEEHEINERRSMLSTHQLDNREENRPTVNEQTRHERQFQAEEERRSMLSTHQIDNVEENRPTVNEQARLGRQVQVGNMTSDTRPLNIVVTEAPKLDILPFDGDVARYPLFKQQVNEAMKNEKFSEPNIVRHLKDRLKGEAFNAVHGALLAGASLTRILHVLDSRFGNKLQVTQAVTSRLLRRPKVSSTDTDDLARYSTEIYNTLAILESMGSENELNNLRTIGMLVEKLPLDSQHAWGSYGRRRADEDGEVTCRMFCEFLEEHTKDRQFGDVQSEGRRRENASKKPRPLPRKVKPAYAMEGAAEARGAPAPEPVSQREATGRAAISCYFCKQPHWISRCKAFQELTCERRWKWAESNSACVRCLSTVHRTQQCHRQFPCGIDGCKEKHHNLLHTAPKTTDVVGTIQPNQKVMLMKTVVIRVHGPRATRRCVAYLDEGSSLTLIERELAEEMGLSMKPETIRIRTMTGVTEHEVGKLDLLISSVATGGKHRMRDAVAVEKLELSRNPVAVKDLAEKYPQLRKIDMPELDEAPRMIIGMDNAELIATRQLRRTSKNGPLLQNTLLGWTVTGRALADVSVKDEEVRFIRRHETGGDSAVIDGLLQDSWTTESFGCAYDRGVPHSPEDRRAEAILQDEVQHDGSRWVAPILLRDAQAVFPPSRQMAERRAKALERKLDKSKKSNDQPTLAPLVYDKMSEMVEKGYFRRLTTDEADRENNKTWYLPLLAVTSKTKPVRLVLDAAAKSEGRCLNDYLMRGPDFTNSIPGIICRWREKPIAVTSDVKAMFSQILVRDSDRASLRFLWRGPRRTGPMDVYESQVVIFGAKSSPAIAGYCFRETGKRFGSALPHVMDAIENGTYVDDIIYSVNTESEAIRLTEDLTSTLAQGGFELSDWTSNSAAVMDAVSGERTSFDEDVLLDVSSSQRTLGTVWKPRSDIMTYRAQLTTPNPTKRNILSVAMSVFDPLGYLTGWMLPVKKTLQDMWSQKRGWEDEPNTQGMKTWDEWTRDLALISSVEVPRHLFQHEAGVTTVEVHAFCDASMDGFCAVVYYRWTNRSDVSVTFVAARCRLAPLKSLSIPRLELQAAVLATRLVCSLRKESRLNWSSVTYWTDSKNVLAWIQAQDRRYHVFVSNRTAEILDKSSADQWRYVPTALNPADGGSRGHRLDDLRPDGVWASGPDFLHQPSDEWPETLSDTPQDILQEDPETKTVFAVSVAQPPVPDVRHSLPDPSRFSRWSTAVRTVTPILKWRNRARKRREDRALTGADSPLELEAETLLMKLAQQDAYAAELRDLQAGLPLDRKSPLAALTVLLMDGLICLDSRTKRSPELSTSARFPAILPRGHGHPCTRLLIQHIHEKMAHRAHDAVLVELRQRCWVPQAAREVRKVASRCQVCKNRKAKPAAPQMAPLPLYRVTMMDGAFRATGLDFFGPMEITRGRSVMKIWGAIFRCLATKAVHIELTERLDTEATLMVISRFQARRGNVREIWSDNAGGFRSASKELKAQFERLDQQQISEKLGLDGINWRFNPPAYPEAGGAWERSIRTAKETLRIILRERRPSFEVLQTLLCEVEKILNSTPLFHVPVDPDDEEPLTPFHFLIGRPSPSYPRGTSPDDSMDLRRRWKHAQTLSDHFWKRWVREYLPTLARRPKWIEEDRDVEVGDVVVIADPQSPRGLWPRGMVEEVLRSEDGRVRSALVRTKHGVMRRPSRKLVVLDVIRGAT